MSGCKMSVNNERQGKVETYISPNSVLCAWMTPEKKHKDFIDQDGTH